jgi:SAM-dependent methyltransferase
MGPQRTRTKTPVGDDQILAVYQSVLGADSIRRHDKTDGWFGRYCGSLADPRQGQRYLRAIRNSLQLHKRPASGLRILEVGCGFGLTCLSLSLMGAESVDCLDTNEQMIATMSSYLQDLPFELQINPRTGLAYDLPYADAQFDLVITIEALSHFLQPQRCLAEAHRVLKPGGQYVIADDNNALNRLSVQATREVWDRFENADRRHPWPPRSRALREPAHATDDRGLSRADTAGRRGPGEQDLLHGPGRAYRGRAAVSR